MTIYDISLPLDAGLPLWPGDPPLDLARVEKIEAGAEANVTRLEMSAHTGTHVDAPYHYLNDSPITVEQLSLQVLTGRACVVQVADETPLLTAQVLAAAAIPPRTRRLLLKTRNSRRWAEGERAFAPDFVGISADGAAYLVRRGVRLVGIDYLSVAPFAASRPTHALLLAAGVVVLEGLNLAQVAPGRYHLYCLPLKLVGADGAPARAILVGA